MSAACRNPGSPNGIGLTFQQVQKYEKGANRVSAGRLQQIADILNVPVVFFYSGMGARAKKIETRGSTGLAFLQTKGAIRLMRAYTEIPRAPRNMRSVVLAESLKNRERG